MIASSSFKLTINLNPFSKCQLATKQSGASIEPHVLKTKGGRTRWQKLQTIRNNHWLELNKGMVVTDLTNMS